MTELEALQILELRACLSFASVRQVRRPLIVYGMECEGMKVSFTVGKVKERLPSSSTKRRLTVTTQKLDADGSSCEPGACLREQCYLR